MEIKFVFLLSLLLVFCTLSIGCNSSHASNNEVAITAGITTAIPTTLETQAIDPVIGTWLYANTETSDSGVTATTDSNMIVKKDGTFTLDTKIELYKGVLTGSVSGTVIGNWTKAYEKTYKFHYLELENLSSSGALGTLAEISLENLVNNQPTYVRNYNPITDTLDNFTRKK